MIIKESDNTNDDAFNTEKSQLNKDVGALVSVHVCDV